MNVYIISRTWSLTNPCPTCLAFSQHCIFILLWSNQQNWQTRALDLSWTPLWWSVKTIFCFSTQSIAVQMFGGFFCTSYFTHCICCPRRCCRHSRRLRHTPSVWGCSDGFCTQTEQLSRIHLDKARTKQDCIIPPKKSLHWSLYGFKHVNLPQWASSAPFSQSFSLSHVQLMGMQRPLGQAKKGVGHFVLLLPLRGREKTR